MAEKMFLYELPANWHWSTLGNVAEIIMGQSPSGNDTTSDSSCTPLIGGANDMGELFPKITRYTKNPTKLSKPNDIIICVRATLGKPIFSDKEYCLGRGVAAIRLSSDSEKFFRYLFINFERYFYDNATGSTFLQISSEKLKKMPIPLPPLDEQKRIVAIIESLFGKLDAAKFIVQKILDGYELRRAAILHKAFTGELTKKFRADSGLTLDDWQEKILGDILLPTENTIPTGKIFHYIDIDSIDNKRQRVKAPKIIETEKAPSRAIRKIKENDVLFSMVRPYLRNIALIDKSLEDCIASSGFFVCRCNENVSSKFLYNFLRSEDAISYLMQFMKGDNSPSIRKEEFLSLSVNLPPLDEQKEIVRVLDSLLEKEQRTKEIAEKILSEIDLLKRTILARAFRGATRHCSPLLNLKFSLLMYINLTHRF